MTHDLKFRFFLEEFKDIFGFNPEIDKNSKKKKYVDEKPIQPFRSNGMLESLSKHKVGVHEGFQDFSNTVQWGTGPGAIRVRVGSQYTLHVERRCDDLEGNKTWITKKVFKINTEEYKTYFESVGDAIHEEIEKISKTPLDGPKKSYHSVEDLARDIADEMTNYQNDSFEFDRFKKVTENNSLLVYVVMGGGVGALQTPASQSRINQIIVDVNFREDTGLIRIMNTAVVTGDEGYSWHLMPSFFTGEYAPTQTAKEIAESVVTAMKWF
jgi:hypothetical protein